MSLREAGGEPGSSLTSLAKLIKFLENIKEKWIFLISEMLKFQKFSFSRLQA